MKRLLIHLTLSVFIGMAYGLLPVNIAHGASKGPSPKSSKQTRKSGTMTNRAALGPDLVVKRIWLDNQCRIHFEIQNKGRRHIPKKAHRKSKVAIGGLDADIQFPMGKAGRGVRAVDPKGRLMKPGGSVRFNSGKRLVSSRTVMVVVDPRNAIAEASETNNTKRASLRPTCSTAPGPVGSAGAQAGSPADVSSMTTPHGTAGRSARPPSDPTKPKQMARALSSTVTIRSFYLRKPPYQLQGSLGPITGAPEYTVNASEPFKLYYTAKVCDAFEAETELNWGFPGNPQWEVQISEDRRTSGKCVSIVGSSEELRKQRDVVFEIMAIGRGAPSSRATRRINLNVQRPQLVLRRPEVNESDMSVVLKVKNTGRVDYPVGQNHIEGYINVTNWNGNITYATERIYNSFVNVPAGEAVELHRFVLTDHDTREHLYAAKKINIRATVSDPGDFLTESGSQVAHMHHWSTREASLDYDLLMGTLSSLISGDIRLHNYQSPGANETSTQPGVASQSWVNIGGENEEFTFPFYRFHVVGKLTGKVRYDYRPFVNDLRADVGDSSSLSILPGNVLKMHIVFETAGTEIHGYRYKDGVYIDDKAPDFDITRLELDVRFYLQGRDGKMAVDRVTVTPALDFTAHERYSNTINKLKPKLIGFMTNQMGGYIRNVVGMNDFVNRLNQGIQSAMGVMGIAHINSFTLSSQGLTIQYVPEG